MATDFDFIPLTRKDFSTLLAWFNASHVQTFYSLKTWTETEIVAKFLPRLNNSPVKCFIIKMKDMPIGFIQSYPGDEYLEKAIGIDFLIGNPHFLNKGLGALMLNAFIAKKLPAKSIIVVDPDIRNTIAIKLFERCGFVKNKVVLSKDELGREAELQVMVKYERIRVKQT